MLYVQSVSECRASTSSCCASSFRTMAMACLCDGERGLTSTFAPSTRWRSGSVTSRSRSCVGVAVCSAPTCPRELGLRSRGVQMAIDTRIHYAALGDLYFDAKNPRLGRQNTGKDLSQDQVLELMKDWALEELAVSFLESGFWPQEALIAVRENAGAEQRLVVVEGNRRLAALKLLV